MYIGSCFQSQSMWMGN